MAISYFIRCYGIRGRLFIWGKNDGFRMGLPEKIVYPEPIPTSYRECGLVCCGLRTTVVQSQDQLWTMGHTQTFPVGITEPELIPGFDDVRFGSFIVSVLFVVRSFIFWIARMLPRVFVSVCNSIISSHCVCLCVCRCVSPRS